MRPFTASAPGKVMLAGGYAVLERPNPCFVLATTARFRSTAEWAQAELPGAPSALPVTIVSPQYNQHNQYLLRLPDAESGGAFALLLHPAAPSEQRRNPYAEHTVAYAVAAAAAMRSPDALTTLRAQCRAGVGLRLTLRADNDFYSQKAQLESRGLALTAASLRGLPAHLPCVVGADGGAEVAKTGLGSSAAMITSVVGAVLGFLGAAALPAAGEARDVGSAGLAAVHGVAQLCHAAVQGKIGSGFDVCAATSGSMPVRPFTVALRQLCLGFSQTYIS